VLLGVACLLARSRAAEGVLRVPVHDPLEHPGHPGHIREEWTWDGDHAPVESYSLLEERAFRLPWRPGPSQRALSFLFLMGVATSGRVGKAW